MTTVPVYIVPRATVDSLSASAPIPSGDLDNYLSLRPGILSDGQCDIFENNIRSEAQRWTAFECFRRVSYIEDRHTVVVFPFWLDLWENFGVRQNIATCIEWLRETYPDNRCLIQWNHDRDSATVPEFENLPPNFYVIQFNTSRPTPNDILVPFWTITQKLDWTALYQRHYRGGFIGHVGSLVVRQKLLAAFRHRPGWLMSADKKALGLYQALMAEFTFALCPRGGGLSSYRFFEALQAGAVPILFADDVALPYPDLNWGELCVRIPEDQADNPELIEECLDAFNVIDCRKRLLELRERFSLAGVQREIHARLTADWN